MRNCGLRKNYPRHRLIAINNGATTDYCLSHLRRSVPPTLRLRPKLHRFDLSLYLLQCWLYNIDNESVKWSLSIRPIVQICGLRFLGLHEYLLSTDARCLILTLWAVQYGRFLPRDAMLSALYAVVVCLSVCLCVCVCHSPVLYQNG